MANNTNVSFYYCKTSLPTSLVEGGIYFVEKENRIYKVTDGSAVDFDINVDWNENNETISSYIKNRTHWKEDIEEVIYKTADRVSIDSIGEATFYKSGTGKFTLETEITSENDNDDGLYLMEELLYSFTDEDGNEYSGTLKKDNTAMSGSFLSKIWSNDVFSYSSSSGISYNFKQFLGQSIRNFVLKSPTIIYHQIDDEYLKPIEKVEIEHGHYVTTEIPAVEYWLDIEITQFEEDLQS